MSLFLSSLSLSLSGVPTLHCDIDPHRASGLPITIDCPSPGTCGGITSAPFFLTHVARLQCVPSISGKVLHGRVHGREREV